MPETLARLDEILRGFRSTEPKSWPPSLSDDREALKVFETWPLLSVDLKMPLVLGGVPMHQHNKWKYAWKFRTVKYDELSKISGLPVDVVTTKVDALVAERLIYPDGTRAQLSS